jgi:hypothetical protein
VLSTGAKLNKTNPNIQDELTVAVEWIVEHKRVLWCKWAPGSGSYINKATLSTRTSRTSTGKL